MGTILLLTEGTNGDVRPFLSLGKALNARAHHVILFTHATYGDLACEAGLDFVPLDTIAEAQAYLGDNHLTNSPHGLRTFVERHILPNIPRRYEAIRNHAQPDALLVTNHTAFLTAHLVADGLGLPVVEVFLAPSHLETTPVLERFLREGFGASVNSIRRLLGLPTITDWRSLFCRATRNIALWPEWLTGGDSKPFDLEVRMAGFVLPEADRNDPLLPPLEEMLKGSKRPVLVTGGSGSLDSAFYACCVEACQHLDRPCIVVSRHGECLPQDLLQKVALYQHLPFSAVFPRVAAVVHHGGIGTCAQALASGAPQIILASGMDRPDNARRMRRLGVAEFLPLHDWRTDRVAGALSRVMTSNEVAERCADLSARTQSADSIKAACELIEEAFAVPPGQTELLSQGARETAVTRLGSALPPELGEQQTPEGPPRWLDGGSAERRELLTLLLRQKAGERLRKEQIPALSREGRSSFPLSSAQKRLWFLEQYEPGQPLYNAFSAFRVTGGLQTHVLEKAVQEIVQRHEVLRTTFELKNGEPVQVIAPTGGGPLPVKDLRHMPRPEREAEARRLAAEEAERPFGLSVGPLIRVSLLHLAAAEYILLVAMHHIIADGWSTGVLVHEIKILYESFLAGNPSPLPALPIQYADFAGWQNERLRGEALQTHLAYWKSQLGDSLPTLQLPTDRPRPPVQTFWGGSQPFTASTELTEALKALGRQEGSTLFMTLLAAFQTLLYRYSNQEDIVVGSPNAGRNQPELEGLIGCFVNSLVLRGDLSGNPSFRTFLGRVRRVALDAYAHQDVPFEKLVEALGPERSLGHSPLFQAMLILQNTPAPAVDLAGLTLVPVEVPRETARFELTLSVTETERGLNGVFEYNADLFDATTVARMAFHFRTLLASIARNPDCPVGELPLLTASERQQIVMEWNVHQIDYPRDACIHELFEQQARLTPDAIAVISERETLSYRELNHRANRVAHYLSRLGVGTETRVGICMSRSTAMIVGLLGVLKAGGAYVPLDPRYPQARLAFMLHDARVSVLLTEEALRGLLPVEQARTMVSMDADWAAMALESDADPPFAAGPENLAYVMYTSGSTGTPKGVMVCHRSVVNLFTGMDQRVGCSEADALLAVTSISFDMSVSELFWTLVRGARVVLLSEEELTEAALLRGGQAAVADRSLKARIAAHGVTLLQCTPSLMRMLLSEDGGAEALWPLRALLLGGESLPVALAGELRRKCPARLLNMYGPTETTIYSATHEVAVVGDAVPIGRPIANTRIYILDRHLYPVPPGVQGDLYVGGDGVTRGYLGRPELTADRFVPDPFGPESGARLYRTGDVARYLPDGNIEYLGRADQQVKIRGFRIELGEIEAALAQHSGVREAVVTAWEAAPGDKRLAAYVVNRVGSELNVAELRSYLSERLPAYMIPASFVALASLPLSPNGKVDRRALPPMVRGQTPGREEGFELPRTPTEEKLAQIWCEVLGPARVGRNDSFFELGGHSLLATRVVSRISDTFGVTIALRQLFERPTLSGLAETIAAVQRDTGPGKAGLTMKIIRTPAGEITSRLAVLSEEDIDALISNVLAAEEEPHDESCG